jgi:hypothetical protein
VGAKFPPGPDGHIFTAATKAGLVVSSLQVELLNPGRKFPPGWLVYMGSGKFGTP